MTTAADILLGAGTYPARLHHVAAEVREHPRVLEDRWRELVDELAPGVDNPDRAAAYAAAYDQTVSEARARRARTKGIR